MLSRGENITKSNSEILLTKSTFEIYREISEGSNGLPELISRIRKVASLDHAAYQALKKQLPYFTGSSFGDKPRCTENFQYASYFIIDIDKCYTGGREFAELRSRISADPRLNLMFTSPGGAGLKLVYPLNESCRSTKFFSDSYRSFAFQLAKDFNIEGKIDLSTHDVTRVCFLSFDRNAFYNALPEKVAWKSYLPAECLFREDGDEDAGEGGEYSEGDTLKGSANCSHDINPDVYRAILKKLNPGRKYPVPRPCFVPEILSLIEDPVRAAVKEHNISVNEIRDIQYGKKFIFRHSYQKAELNIFYGRKGFSVVISPSGGTHPDLNKVVYEIVSGIIYNPSFEISPDHLPEIST